MTTYLHNVYDEDGNLIKSERVTVPEAKLGDYEVELVEDFNVAEKGTWPQIESKEDIRRD